MTSKSNKFSTSNVERALGALAIIILGIAWYVGYKRVEADARPFLKEALPGASHFESLGDKTYEAYKNPNKGVLLGYVNVTSSMGYGGPLTGAVATDTKGEIVGFAIIDHKETPSYISRVFKSNLQSTFESKTYKSKFVIGKDIDSVSGATLSATAITQIVRDGSRAIAKDRLSLKVPVEAATPIKFGVPEIVLLGLFVFGVVARTKRFKYKKIARWISMLTGLLVLGFVYNKPLTISMINQTLLGFWPDWQSHLYWFLLMGGVIFFMVADKRNPYCLWFCPFGAAQECLGKIGKAKKRSEGRFGPFLKWLKRTLVLAAITMALVYRNPGMASYEVFGTLFDFIGTGYQFALLGIVVIASLFILRPWCTYLCPVRPVDKFARTMRKWFCELWKKKSPIKSA